MKILGIDFGEKRIGLAISDETQTLARELDIWSPAKFWLEIADLVSKQAVEKVVVGLPLNMSGEQTEKSVEVQTFVDQLSKLISQPIELTDERLSSVMAAQVAGQDRNIDSLAAQIFLQNYLDKNKK